MPSRAQPSGRVDLLAIAGVILGVAAIVYGNLLEGGTVGMLLNKPAALIVLGGTLGAIVLQTPAVELRRALVLTRWIFMPPQPIANGAVERLVVWSRQTRKHGLIGLEQEVDKQPEAFVRKGLELIIDASEPEGVRRALELDITTRLERDIAAAAVFRNMGGYAPTIGIIGAVLGLMQVMTNLADPSELGPGIATAFVATIYGLSFANLLLLPVADRLKALALRQSHARMLWLEGLMAIATGEHPTTIQMRLAALEQA